MVQFDFQFGGAVNFEALNDEIKAISTNVDGIMWDGKAVGVVFFGTPTSQQLDAITRAISRHDATAQTKKQVDQAALHVKLVEVQKDFAPIDVTQYKGQLLELALRIQRLELLHMASGELAAVPNGGVAASK